MRSESSWQGRLAVWAWWLLGGALAIGLAGAAVTLSPDGARLRRLVGVRAAGERDRALAHSATFEGVPIASGRTSWTPFGAASSLDGGSPGLDGAGAASQDSAGWVMADVIGPTQGVDVFLDGQWKGVTPVIMEGVRPGVHNLAFATGGQSWEEKIRVSMGDTTIAACAAPERSGGGQLVIRTADSPSKTGGERDSVLVDGLFVGVGELSVEVNAGYHSVSFLKKREARVDVVILVPDGSIQYISAPEMTPPFSINGRPPVAEGGAVRFEARLSKSVTPPPELSLLVLAKRGSSLKAASMPRDPSGGAYAGAVSIDDLPPAAEVRYFFRAILSSGEEIDSPIYTYKPSG